MRFLWITKEQVLNILLLILISVITFFFVFSSVYRNYYINVKDIIGLFIFYIEYFVVLILTIINLVFSFKDPLYYEKHINSIPAIVALLISINIMLLLIDSLLFLLILPLTIVSLAIIILRMLDYTLFTYKESRFYIFALVPLIIVNHIQTISLFNLEIFINIFNSMFNDPPILAQYLWIYHIGNFLFFIIMMVLWLTYSIQKKPVFKMLNIIAITLLGIMIVTDVLISKRVNSLNRVIQYPDGVGVTFVRTTLSRPINSITGVLLIIYFIIGMKESMRYHDRKHTKIVEEGSAS